MLLMLESVFEGAANLTGFFLRVCIILEIC